MGSADWTEMTDGLDVNAVDRGVTTGLPRPNGGGNFVFGFNSLVVAEGAVAYFNNQSGFAPTAANKGGRVTGAIKRVPSSGATGFAPFFYVIAQGTSVNDSAYILGLQDDSPYRIALRKGKLVEGVPLALPGASGILRRSTSTFSPDTWHHLRLDVVVNTNGDVILQAFSSDLNAHAVTSPTWTAIPGIEDSTLVATFGAGTAFIDDSLGINSGSPPFTSGRNGFGFYTKDVSRRGAFDQIESIRQS